VKIVYDCPTGEISWLFFYGKNVFNFFFLLRVFVLYVPIMLFLVVVKACYSLYVPFNVKFKTISIPKCWGNMCFWKTKTSFQFAIIAKFFQLLCGRNMHHRKGWKSLQKHTKKDHWLHHCYESNLHFLLWNWVTKSREYELASQLLLSLHTCSIQSKPENCTSVITQTNRLLFGLCMHINEHQV